MRASLKLLVSAAFVAAAPAAAAEPAAAVDPFRGICLDNAQSPQAARDAATALGFEKQAPVPEPAGRGFLESYAKSSWELLIRDSRSGRFSCIFLFPLDGAPDSAVAEAVGGLPDLSLKSSKANAKGLRARWNRTTGPKGSEVVLSIDSDTGSRVAIITLESRSTR